MRDPASSPKSGRVRRVAWLGTIALFAVLVLAGCSVDKNTGGDPAGLTTSSSQNLVGIAPGTITSDDLTKAKTTEPFAVQLADLVDQNRLAINFSWLLVTGFLVMFMQAGFALVETGFTRAKNALHTMSMNFMIYAIGIIGFFTDRLCHRLRRRRRRGGRASSAGCIRSTTRSG